MQVADLVGQCRFAVFSNAGTKCAWTSGVSSPGRDFMNAPASYGNVVAIPHPNIMLSAMDHNSLSARKSPCSVTGLGRS